jgi:hypothetical protein
MNNPTPRLARCAVYTRKSSEHNLDLAFTSLDAQREACEAYIRSQAGEGWRLVPDRYDDGGLSGASLDRAALQALMPATGSLAPPWRHRRSMPVTCRAPRRAVPMRQNRCRWRARPRGPRFCHVGEQRQHQARRARRGAPPRGPSMPPTCRAPVPGRARLVCSSTARFEL